MKEAGVDQEGRYRMRIADRVGIAAIIFVLAMELALIATSGTLH
jgi:hypothetical protein